MNRTLRMFHCGSLYFFYLYSVYQKRDAYRKNKMQDSRNFARKVGCYFRNNTVNKNYLKLMIKMQKFHFELIVYYYIVFVNNHCVFYSLIMIKVNE